MPLGTITGIPMLSGVGPKITMKFTPVGAVLSDFDSEFVAAGINQTVHRVKLRLTDPGAVPQAKPGMPGAGYVRTAEVDWPANLQ